MKNSPLGKPVPPFESMVKFPDRMHDVTNVNSLGSLERMQKAADLARGSTAGLGVASNQTMDAGDNTLDLDNDEIINGNMPQ